MDFKPVKLPEDANAHKNIIEWWYFNGHLKDKNGHRYSFMDCLFQADLKRVNLPFLRNMPFKKFASSFLPYVHFSHSIVSDIGKQKNYKDIQHISLLSRDSFKRRLLYADYTNPFTMHGYANHEIAQTAESGKKSAGRTDGKTTGSDKFHIKTEKLDLELISKKPVLLEQGKGIVPLGDKKSYYYSFTDLAAKGLLNLDGKIIGVEGKAWMDHMWADEQFTDDRWSWFCVQLENGTDMMIAEYGDKKNPTFLVDIMHRDGKTEHGTKATIIPATDRKLIWKSRKTKAKYPLAWTLIIPGKNGGGKQSGGEIVIKVHATMKDQEMIYGSINYWEGPLNVTAEIDGKKIKGVGFMELLGIPSDYNFVLLAAGELEQSIQNAIFK